MLTLESSALIGRGLRRECYFHPEDENKCIKVVVAGDHKETVREQSYYRLLERRGIVWRMLAKYYGNVATNLMATLRAVIGGGTPETLASADMLSIQT